MRSDSRSSACSAGGGCGGKNPADGRRESSKPAQQSNPHATLGLRHVPGERAALRQRTGQGCSDNVRVVPCRGHPTAFLARLASLPAYLADRVVQQVWSLAQVASELGTDDEVVIGLGGVDRPVDVILDNVGGPQLVAAWGLLAPGGACRALAGPLASRRSSRRIRRSACRSR